MTTDLRTVAENGMFAPQRIADALRTTSGILPLGATMAQIIPMDMEHIFKTRIDPP